MRISILFNKLRNKLNKLLSGIDWISLKNPRYLILLFMVALYPLVVVPWPWLDYFYAPRYIILAILSLIACFFLVRDKGIPDHPVFIPLGFFVLFAVISALLAPNQQTAWIGLFRYSGMSTYLFCIALFMLASRSPHGEKLLKNMVACAVIVSLLAVLQHFNLHLVPHEEFRAEFSPFGTMGNPNFLGTYVVFILPGAITFYLTEKKNKWLIASAVIYAALIVCMTRGAWLVFLAVMVVIFAFSYKKATMLKPFGVLVLIFLLVTGSLIIFSSDSTLISRAHSIPMEITASVQLEDSAGTYRIFIWKEALRLLPQFWVFGMGPEHFADADIRPFPGVIADKVHNVYLEIALTMGVFALAAYLVFLSFFLQPRYDVQRFQYFIMIFAYATQAFFNIDVVMVMPLFWITMGLALATNRIRKLEE